MPARRSASVIISEQLAARWPEERVKYLKEVMATAAADLTAIAGPRATAETAYRLGDSVVGCITDPDDREGA